MKKILKGLFLCIIFIGTVGCPMIVKCMDQDEILYQTIFKTGVLPHEGYKVLNEGDAFIQTYNQNYNQGGLSSFESLDQNKYKPFIEKEELFNTALSPKKKILNLMRWCQLAGCPLLAVSQYRQFFHRGLHIYDPKDLVGILGAGVLSNVQRENLQNEFETYPYEKGCTQVGIKRKTDNTNQTYRERTVTQDLKDNAIMYLYLNTQNTNFDQQNFTQNSPNHYQTRGKAKISYDFLKDYIVPLDSIPYIDQILGGLALLPKNVVNVIRGKAIYLSTETGVSLNAHMTSHNAPVATYLGLIPGVFIEHHPAPPDNGVNMTLRNFVHEIGHLIDYTVLQPKLQEDSILFPHQFLEFQQLKGKRGGLFKKNPTYVKNTRTDLCKTKPGYMTNYSESNAEEDFAEHFTYFVISDFKSLFEKVMKKNKKDGTLKNKYNFMKKMIEDTSSERKDL